MNGPPGQAGVSVPLPVVVVCRADQGHVSQPTAVPVVPDTTEKQGFVIQTVLTAPGNGSPGPRGAAAPRRVVAPEQGQGPDLAEV